VAATIGTKQSSSCGHRGEDNLSAVAIEIPRFGSELDRAIAEIAKYAAAQHETVSTLFTTTDANELQRPMFLIRQLDCKISTRL
jgi:hypothetical protein